MISARLLIAFAGAVPDATYVQIGASDGVTLDPIAETAKRHGWRGVLVEPAPPAFERLRDNYSGEPRVQLINAAVSGRPGSEVFHYFDPGEGGDGPWWGDAIGSFERSHLESHLDPELHDRIRQTEVRCLSFQEVIDAADFDTPDLVLVDTEGHDFEIVSAIDLDSIRPRLLVYEHEHLSAADRSDLEARLRDAGYALVADGLDTWCMDLAPDDDLTSAWRRAIGG